MEYIHLGNWRWGMEYIHLGKWRCIQVLVCLAGQTEWHPNHDHIHHASYWQNQLAQLLAKHPTIQSVTICTVIIMGILLACTWKYYICSMNKHRAFLTLCMHTTCTWLLYYIAYYIHNCICVHTLNWPRKDDRHKKKHAAIGVAPRLNMYIETCTPVLCPRQYTQVIRFSWQYQCSSAKHAGCISTL